MVEKFYSEFLPLATCIYLTRVATTIEGDTWFPVLDAGEWNMVESDKHATGGVREFGFSFEVWMRTREIGY